MIDGVEIVVHVSFVVRVDGDARLVMDEIRRCTPVVKLVDSYAGEFDLPITGATVDEVAIGS